MFYVYRKGVGFPGEKSESLNFKKVREGDIHEEKEQTKGPGLESRKNTLKENGVEGSPAK